MTNIGYWLPVDHQDPEKLYYVIRHASRDAAKASWAAFGADPEWKAVAAASEANGKIVAKVDSTYLAATDYSPAAIPALTGAHAYELRIYTTNEGKLDALDARFRNHTTKLFEKYGMTNVLYTHPTDADKGAGHTLVYILAHASKEAGLKSFEAFRADPEWVKVKAESEAAGPILSQPVESIYLTPTDFSPLK
jgi:NIPSNAP